MKEYMKKVIRVVRRYWNILMGSGTVRLSLMILPFVLAMIGYWIYYNESLSFSIFSSLKVYAGGFDAGYDRLNWPALTAATLSKEQVARNVLMRVCLESARWMGLIIAGTFLFRFLREQIKRMEVARKARRPEAIAVHGTPHYEMLLKDVLGKQAITENVPEKFDAKSHVLAFDTDQQLLSYLSENFSRFADKNDRQVYLCLLSSSHTKYSSKGFIINNMAEDCARLYWKQHYVRRFGDKPERRIALIGFGHYGQALLNQALMVNVFLDGTPPMEYHVFGDSQFYRRLHEGIASFASINEESSERDSIFFHEEGWESGLSVLGQADRVILCSDSEEENIDILSLLDNELEKTKIYIRSSDVHMLKALYAEHEVEENNPDAHISVFGTDRMLYTRESILDEKLLSVAKRCHARYMWNNESACIACGRKTNTTACIRACSFFERKWNEMGVFTQRSNIYAADHMEVKLREMLKKDCDLTAQSLEEYAGRLKACCHAGSIEPYLELEHRRWMRYHFFGGWKYADIPKKCKETRRHPSLRPYKELSARERSKDMDAYMTLCDLEQEDMYKDGK